MQLVTGNNFDALEIGNAGGLAEIRARLEKLDGRFEVNSKTGQGTIVRFDLPLD